MTDRRDQTQLRFPYPLPSALAELRRLYGPHVPLHILHDIHLSAMHRDFHDDRVQRLVAEYLERFA